MSDPAGYSGTPLPKKLGLKPESRLLVLNGPEDFYRRTRSSWSIPRAVALPRVLVFCFVS